MRGVGRTRPAEKNKGKGNGGKGEHEGKGGFGSKGTQQEMETLKDEVEGGTRGAEPIGA